MNGQAGKGSKRRPTNEEAYREGWDRIFRGEVRPELAPKVEPQGDMGEGQHDPDPRARVIDDTDDQDQVVLNESLVEAMTEAVDIWWDRWHRFAEYPLEQPPQYIVTLAEHVFRQTGRGFDYDSGRWS